jgi:DMSO/TMAO reductase YedYZ molybdopterin-dependent catalytic subunit
MNGDIHEDTPKEAEENARQEDTEQQDTEKREAETQRPDALPIVRGDVPGETPVGRDGEDAERAIRRLSRRSFLWAGVTLATGYFGWQSLIHGPQQDGIRSPFRHALQFDESVARRFFSPARLAPNFAVSQAEAPKVNGDLGLGDELDADVWRLSVEGVHGHDTPVMLTLKNIQTLPRVEMVTEHKCIEGWSVIVHWAGARFADFAAKYPPSTRSGDAPDVLHKPEALTRYVGLMTPDENYYVGLDMESALHPQTLLCYEMNGKPLTDDHGAPLRLVVPVKYGIKSIKRIGSIRYTDKQPADYWAEQGYDWYAGH